MTRVPNENLEGAADALGRRFAVVMCLDAVEEVLERREVKEHLAERYKHCHCAVGRRKMLEDNNNP